MIEERLTRLRGLMKERGITVYVVPTADFHESEYVGQYFKCREYITGFTGSAGTAVITLDEAGLWTDARYFVQAKNQLKGTTVTLYEMGEEGVPTVSEYIDSKLTDGDILGFDGRVINASLGDKFNKIALDHGASIHADEDLIGMIWDDRIKLSSNKAWILSEEYTGQSTEAKLAEVIKVMDEEGASVHIMSSLYDIAWLLNIRGSDITYVPVVLAYMIITKTNRILFLDDNALSDQLKEYFDSLNISLRPYEDIYDVVADLNENERILMDESIVNYRIKDCIKNKKGIINKQDPTVMLKAIKNEVQLENIRKAHLKDAVAMCKFMYFLKNKVGKESITEISAADYLEELRRSSDDCFDLSFETICGYAEHGAIVHYAATKETDVEILPGKMLLVDSGGHYLTGTTDITRTFILGEVTREEKEDFTRVCISNMELANAIFLYGCTGRNLDILARKPLWDAYKDYKHGTGHGVGYVLNVHEGPNAFRWRKPANPVEDCVLEEGMITTDEPGIYIEGKYGIRTENELICRKGIKNEFGQFMYFENITYVPIDLDGIIPQMMSDEQKRYLNDYHRMVYEKIAPYLTAKEKEFLAEYTRAV